MKADWSCNTRKAPSLASCSVLRASFYCRSPNLKPPRPSTPKTTTMQKMQSLHDHRLRIRRGLDWLKRFHFTQAPKLSLELHGSLDRFTEMDARLFFDAEGLSYEGYTCEELRAEVEYESGFVDLTRFHLKDRLGELNASATWMMGAEDLRFHLTSSADLTGLAETFLDSDNLREIVFYEPPHLALEGVWHVDGPLAKHKTPGTCHWQA